MKTIVRELKNISNFQIPVQISPTTIIYLGPGIKTENKTIYNLEEIQDMVEVKQDLSEVKPVVEKRQYLKG